MVYKLVKSGVVFDSVNHTYTLDGKQLSGSTSLLDRQLFKDKYSLVNFDYLYELEDAISYNSRGEEKTAKVHCLFEPIGNDPWWNFQKAEVEKLRADLQKALDENDYASIKEKLDTLEKAAQAAAAQMYQNQGAAQGDAGNTSFNDDVMDAEFTEK